MSTYSTYTCMECNKPIAWAAVVQKCKVCHMDLCKKCSKKHNGVCIWCYQHAPDQYVKMKKATEVAMIFMPAFILFMPAPMPAVLLIATNPSIIYSMLIYAGATYIVLGIMRSKAAKMIMARIPADVETLDEKKTTAAGVQTQALISHLGIGSREPPVNEVPLQAPAASADPHNFDIAADSQGPGVPSGLQMDAEGTVTCRNCENVFRRTSGANICPACGFIYRD
jgi:hypothetical protein